MRLSKAQFNEQDLSHLRQVLSAYTTKCRGNTKKALELTAVRLVMALRTRTKVAPKKRKVVENPDFGSPNEHGPGVEWREWALRRPHGRHGAYFIPLDGDTQAQAKADARITGKEKIKLSGVAKKTWAVTLAKLGKAAAGTTTDIPIREGTVEVTRSSTGGLDRLMIHNRLDYIMSALVNKQGSLRDACKAAADALRHQMERAHKEAKQGTKL